MVKNCIILAAGIAAGYLLANKIGVYPVFSQAYDLGAGLNKQ